MKIAIIGAGNVGSALARATKAAGHEVVVTAKSKDKVEALATELDIGAAASNLDAVERAEAVILAIPYTSINDVLSEVGEAVGGKIVIDATNPIKPDLSGVATEETSAAEEIQSRAPGAKVVKAFNTVTAPNQTNPVVDGIQLDGFAAADDAGAKQEVLGLLERIGFRPIDVGPLSAARHLESMAFINIWLNATNGWSWQTAWKLLGPAG